MPPHDSSGFSLIEALVATTIMVAALGILGHLTLASSRAVGASRSIAVAVLSARQKMEQLRVLPADHPLLAPSPANALHYDAAGYHDRVNAAGAAVLPPADAAFVRRWSVEPLPGSDDAVVLQVRVIPLTAAVGPGGGARFVVIKPVQVP